MRKPMVAGNWKMHGHRATNATLLDAIVGGLPTGVDVAVYVPFPYLEQVSMLLAKTPLTWGAQTLHAAPSGAYTGEVSAQMLVEFACRSVLVGHSERRALFGETDAQIAAKFVAAQAAGLQPVLCVGETLAQREAGQTEAVVAAQLQAVIEAAGVEALSHAVLAYEPVWAIGTGQTASPAQAQAVHAFLRQQVAGLAPEVALGLRILYGGSVKANNAASLFAMADVDGGLIGGASLVAEEFLAICAAAAHTR